MSDQTTDSLIDPPFGRDRLGLSTTTGKNPTVYLPPSLFSLGVEPIRLIDRIDNARTENSTNHFHTSPFFFLTCWTLLNCSWRLSILGAFQAIITLPSHHTSPAHKQNHARHQPLTFDPVYLVATTAAFITICSGHPVVASRRPHLCQTSVRSFILRPELRRHSFFFQLFLSFSRIGTPSYHPRPL